MGGRDGGKLGRRSIGGSEMVLRGGIRPRWAQRLARVSGGVDSNDGARERCPTANIFADSCEGGCNPPHALL